MVCVRWYLSFKLSFRDLVAMMNERGVGLAHTTILRWVQHYTPEFEKRWKQYARTIGGSWRMDETYVKLRGEWVPDVNAAKAFLRKAMKSQRILTNIMLDAYTASHGAIIELKGMGELPTRVRVRTSKYLNNAIEQDHRRVKPRLRPMLGLKSFQTAAVVIGGIELAEKIKKGQFKLGKLGGRTATMPKSGKLRWPLKQSHLKSKRQDRPNRALARVCTRASRSFFRSPSCFGNNILANSGTHRCRRTRLSRFKFSCSAKP